MKELYRQHPEYLGHGACDPGCVVRGEHYRFSVLTERLLRLEYSESGVFEDRPSQVVLNRAFPLPEFHVTESEERLEISTVAFHLVYNKKEFAPENLYIDAKNRYTNYGGRWKYGATTYGNPARHHNLLGTTRTLDKIDGAYPLEFGLQDTSGRTFFDDSSSLLLDEKGWPTPRIEGNSDVYFLCYGHDYFGTIADFYRLTGAPPMLPRYAYGNWWSRYWKYTEESYSELLAKFRAHGMPFTVAMLDMDWHITEVEEKYGRGWTGFTWNREMFPDPKRFLTEGLHKNGYRCGLNLHPADGVQGFEEAYPVMAERMGVDASQEEPVNFDCADPKFMKAYFEDLIRPHEDMGADFWWIDWQQGTESGIKNLDPLWALNHFHYLDNCKPDRRGFILSRYAGLGGHRYPFGFSGDTITTWNSLAFQPYFTANAANVGYPCWSHDIGGFKTGVRERELFVRWVQFGVFSPVMRMHSSNNPFTSKEPWVWGEATEQIVARYFRLRHRLIPYIYSENYRTHADLRPMITPLYYYHDEKAALDVPNEYCFGSQLVVCPMTSPTAFDSGLSTFHAYLPSGIWTDFFTGATYRGGRKLPLCRPIEDQAVLARAGAILPMGADLGGDNSVANPERMDIYVFPGADGSYELFEDAGDGYGYREGQYAMTKFTLDWKGATFTAVSEGERSVLPAMRTYTVHFRGFEKTRAEGEGIVSQAFDAATRTLSVELAPVCPDTPISLTLEKAEADQNTGYKKAVLDFLMSAQLPVDTKNEVNRVFKSAKLREDIAVGLNNLELSKDTRDALYELAFRI